MKRSILLTKALALSSILISATAFAQVLAPATSEDLNDFDRQISQVSSAKKTAPTKPTPEKQSASSKNDFGKTVSAEAKSLQDDHEKRDLRSSVRQSESRGGESHQEISPGEAERVTAPKKSKGHQD